MYSTKQMLTTKEGMQKQNNKMKFQVQLQKFMHKKVQEMRGMQVERHPYLLEVVLHMVQKVKVTIRLEN